MILVQYIYTIKVTRVKLEVFRENRENDSVKFMTGMCSFNHLDTVEISLTFHVYIICGFSIIFSTSCSKFQRFFLCISHLSHCFFIKLAWKKYCKLCLCHSELYFQMIALLFVHSFSSEKRPWLVNHLLVDLHVCQNYHKYVWEVTYQEGKWFSRQHKTWR